jgi:hypothetical protein
MSALALNLTATHVQISELREVCPSLSEEEAEMALKMSGGK